jgi:hypothetical protein
LLERDALWDACRLLRGERRDVTPLPREVRRVEALRRRGLKRGAVRAKHSLQLARRRRESRRVARDDFARDDFARARRADTTPSAAPAALSRASAFSGRTLSLFSTRELNMR